MIAMDLVELSWARIELSRSIRSNDQNLWMVLGEAA